MLEKELADFALAVLVSAPGEGIVSNRSQSVESTVIISLADLDPCLNCCASTLRPTAWNNIQ